MLRKRNLFTHFTMFTLLLAVSTPALARDILTLVPKDAVGFAMVNNLAEVNFKAVKLGAMFNAPLPSVLTLLEMQSGLQGELDEDGALLFVLLPSDEGNDEPKPLVALPVTDYKKAVTQIGGNTSDEISAVNIAGKDLLAANVGSYIVLVEPDRKSFLVALLEKDAKATEVVKPFQAWAAKQDVAVVILPPGLQELIGDGIKNLEEMVENFPGEVEGQSFADSMQVYTSLLKSAREEVQALAFGIKVSDSGDLALALRFNLIPGGKLAKVTGNNDLILTKSMQIVPAGDFVFAASSAWSVKFGDAYMNWAIKMMKSSGNMYGLANLSDADRDKMLESTAKAMEGIKSMNFFMNAGEEGDPLYSNIFFGLETEDSSLFIKNYEQAIVQYNKAMSTNKKSSGMKYEIENIKHEGKDGLKLSMDLKALIAAQMGAKPETQTAMNTMIGKMFGADGIMTMHILSMRKEAVFGGIGSLEKVANAANTLKSGQLGNEKSQVATTAALLPKDACAVGYLSPKGLVSWVTRIVTQMMPFVPADSIPEFPATPPVGFAAQASEQSIDLHFVLPQDTLQGISEYVQGLQNQ